MIRAMSQPGTVVSVIALRSSSLRLDEYGFEVTGLYPTHDHTPCLVPEPIVPVAIFQFVSALSPEMSNGFRTVEPFHHA
jgi:hypothetical protein